MSGPSLTKIYHKKAYPAIDPTRPQLSAKGKTIVITGGGTGIGAEIALSFAKASAARIAILGRRLQPLRDTKSRISKSFSSTEILTIPTDITKASEVTSAFERITADGHTIDILISNAAIIGPQQLLSDVSPDDLLSGILPNLQGNFNLTTSFLKHASAGATLIEINSAAAHLTFATKFGAYCISKMATARFYGILAYERPDLHVYCVQPGAVETDLAREARYKPRTEGEEWSFDGERAGNLDSPDCVDLPGQFCVWLASPEARFLKGRFLWANWDVQEMMQRKEEILGGNLLEMGMIGWPFER